MHVGLGEAQAAVLRHGAVVDVDAQIGAVGADHAQPVGDRVEVDRDRRGFRQRHAELRLLRRLAGGDVDRPDRCRRGRGRRACRRRGARRCRRACPRRRTPSSSSSTFLAPTSTMASVSSPRSAARLWACAAPASAVDGEERCGKSEGLHGWSPSGSRAGPAGTALRLPAGWSGGCSGPRFSLDRIRKRAAVYAGRGSMDRSSRKPRSGYPGPMARAATVGPGSPFHSGRDDREEVP